MGVIGYGGRIRGVIKQIKGICREAKVTAIADPRLAEIKEQLGADAEGIAFFPDADKMLAKAELDGILIGTRCDLHTPMAVKAMQRNLPLFLEKPVAISMEQIRQLHEASLKFTAPSVISFPLRLTTFVQRAKELIDAGEIGRLEHIQATNNVTYGSVYFDKWYRDYNITNGLFLQKATHDLDYISYLAGDRIATVAAMMSRGRVYGGDKPAGLRCNSCDEYKTCHESPFWKYYRLGAGEKNEKGDVVAVNPEDHPCPFGVDVGTPETGMNEDSSSCLYEFDSGLQGVYTQNFFVRRDAGYRGATLIGTDGTIKFDWYTGDFQLISHHRPLTQKLTIGQTLGHYGGDAELAYDFVRGMRGELKETRSPLSAGIQSALVCYLCREAALKRTFLEVPVL
jgi:predicted dehydrogenase